MAVSSVLSPEKIVGGRKVSPSSFQNFVSGGSPLGSSVVSSAANNVVGFQRASVRPATPDLSSIVNTISSNILSQVSNQIESVTNISNKNVDTKIQEVRSEITREIQPLYTKQENNITQLQSVVQNITQNADATITKIVEEYRKKVSEVDAAKPTGILGNFLKVFKGALDFIQFFASKKNLDTINSNLKALQKTFADSFEVAKLIRNTIKKIVDQLSNLPKATPSGSPGLNIDLKIPGPGLKQTAPRGMGNLFKKGAMLALGAGGLAAGAGAVNALADTGVAPVQNQPGFMGGLVEGLSGIVDSFTSAVNSLIKGSSDRSGGTSGGGGGSPSTKSPGSPGGGPDAPSSGKPGVTTTGEKGVLDLIASVEQGPEGYDSYNTSAGKTPGKATEQTIGWLSKNAKGAIGRYQQMPQFLLERAKRAGFDENTKFTPEVQDAITLNELRTSHGLNDFLSGKITEEQFLQKLAPTWRGLPQGQINSRKLGGTPEMTYQDRYANRNLAGKSYNVVINELKRIREGGNKPIKVAELKGQGGPDLPDWKLSPEKREELKNMASKVAQPPPSQAAPSVTMMPIDMTSSAPQQRSSGSGSPASGPSAPAGSKGPTAPFLPAGNPDNFLILYSKITYNIVDG